MKREKAEEIFVYNRRESFSSLECGELRGGRQTCSLDCIYYYFSVFIVTINIISFRNSSEDFLGPWEVVQTLESAATNGDYVTLFSSRLC